MTTSDGRSYTAGGRISGLPDSAWWFIAGMATGMLAIILMLALFAGGTIYAETGGVAF